MTTKAKPNAQGVAGNVPSTDSPGLAVRTESKQVQAMFEKTASAVLVVKFPADPRTDSLILHGGATWKIVEAKLVKPLGTSMIVGFVSWRAAMIRARFRISLPDVGKRIDHLVVLVQKKVAFQLLEGIVNMNPVLTGRSRGNWYVTIGAPSDEYQEEGFASSAEATVQRGRGVVERITTLGTVYITNNTPYITELEKGTSTQAPQGMVQVTLDRVGAQF